MSQLLPYGFGLLAGSALLVQIAVNAALRQRTGLPYFAALTSYVVGMSVMFAIIAITRAPWPAVERVQDTSWWMWTGGALGAIYVVASVLLAPRLGAATLTGLIIAGQLIAAIAVDHMGWFGLPERAVTPGRALGAVLLGVAVWLVRRG